MAASDNFTHFLLSMGNLEDNDEPRNLRETLFKVLDFCQGLQKKFISLESAMNEVKKENGQLRAQVDKMKSELSEKIDSAVKGRMFALEDRTHVVETKLRLTREKLNKAVTAEEVAQQIKNNNADTKNDLINLLEDRLDDRAPVRELIAVKSIICELKHSHDDIAERFREWARYRQLQEETETGGEEQRTPFSLLHLLHPSKSVPLEWFIESFSNFKRLATNNLNRRLYSRPFGFEKDGTVRCVIRLVAVFLPGDDVVQFALEILFATKYNRKFDFRFQILPSTPHGKPLIKTFSSTEICVPRYWFPQNELQPSGLVSFALAVKEDQLRQDGLLVDDRLHVQVGLRD